MALNDKKYEKFYATSGSDGDKANSVSLTKAERDWDYERATGCEFYLNHDEFAPLLFQLQQMQDELDALRAEISNNKDKTGITTSQASAITANTAKVSFTGGTKTALSFGDMITTPGAKGGKTTYSIAMTAVSGVGSKAITKSVILQLT